jgi:hypothetical protein
VCHPIPCLTERPWQVAAAAMGAIRPIETLAVEASQ